MKDNWLIIVNPASGNGRGGKTWEKQLAGLREAGLNPDIRMSEKPGHVEQLAAEAIAEGYRKLASFGGDGTLNALVNGVMQQQHCRPIEVVLTHLSCGTGNDWCKTFNVPQDPKQWAEMLQRNLVYAHDVGVADVQRDGKPHRHYFVNIVGMAYDSHVVKVIDDKRMKGGLVQGKMLYDYVVAAELLFFKKPELELRYDEKVERQTVFNIAISICRYNGGGMLPTPFADPSDGQLDVTVFGHMPLWMTLRDLPKLKKGTFFGNPNIRWFRTDVLEVDGLNGPDLVEADGESIGQSPARFTVMQQALRFVVNTLPA
jgi:YegS/Rv2252/BmrU family lipid kinase